MALTEKRLGEIAVKVLAHKMVRDGMMVKPKELRSEVFNSAKSLGVSPVELAEFLKVGHQILFAEVNKELDGLITSVGDWQPKP